jgi:hypothetical protein
VDNGHCRLKGVDIDYIIGSKEDTPTSRTKIGESFRVPEKCTGDMDRARTVMGQAVLYETPWDQDNVERQRKLCWIEELVRRRERR